MKNRSYNLYFILLLTFLTVKSADSLAEGLEGNYMMTGYALTDNGDTLKKVQIIVYYEDEVDTLHTDSNGKYITKIYWVTACPSGNSPSQTKKLNKKFNSEFIYFRFKDTKIKIKNDWENYIGNNADSQKTKIENLTF